MCKTMVVVQQQQRSQIVAGLASVVTSAAPGECSKCNRVISNTNRDGVGAVRRRQHETVSATTPTPLTQYNKGGKH